MDKAPVYFEVAGEGGTGKTFVCCTAFPRPFLVDCTPRGDGRFTAQKVFGDGFGDRYFYARSLDDVIKKVSEVAEGGKFATVAIDEYSGLRKLGASWYMKTFDKKAVFPSTDWGIISRKINEGVVWKLQDSGLNIVVTSGFHDVYEKDVKTGGKASNSPPNASLDIDFRIMLVENDKGTDVDIHVVKNKFKAIKDRKRIMKSPLTWKDVKKEASLVGFEYCE